MADRQRFGLTGLSWLSEGGGSSEQWHVMESTDLVSVPGCQRRTRWLYGSGGRVADSVSR